MTRLFVVLFFVGTTISAFAQTAEDKLFTEAENRYLNGNYLYALEAYTSFVDRYPLSDRVADARYRSGVCLYRLERYDEARAVFSDVEKRYRASRYYNYVYFWQGLTLYQLKQYSPAVDSLSAFLRRVADPELTPQALLYRGLSQIALTNYSAATQSLITLVQDYGDSSFSSYGLVLLMYTYLKDGLYDNLLALTEEIPVADLSEKWQPRYRFYQAEALWEEGRQEEAQELYAGLLDAEPEIAAVAYRRLFLAAEQAGSLAEMEDLVRRAESRFSASPAVLEDLWVRAGIESYRRGRTAQAEVFLLKVWNLPERRRVNQAVPLYLAEIRIGQKRLAEAREILTGYLELKPAETGFTLMRLGDIALQEGNYELAARYFERFIGENPGSARFQEAGYLLAYARYRQGYIDEALELSSRLVAEMTDSPLLGNVVDLNVTVLKEKGETREAARRLRAFIAGHPRDIGARVDYLKLLFSLKDYTAVLQASEQLLGSFPRLEEENLPAFVLAHYLRGLAQVSAKAYREALGSLSEVTPQRTGQAGMDLVLPYVGYYQGWSWYRMGDFERARQTLQRMLSDNTGHPLFARALYLVGWCDYSLGEYEKATGNFARLAAMNTDLAARAAFLQAKSLLAQEKLPEAARIFQSVIDRHAASGFADDALFEYAGIMVQQGNTREAAARYWTLYQRYPSSSVAGEALYKRGEVFFDRQMYAEARDAFYEYRKAFPAGRLLDASLYWGAQASLQLEEDFEAALLLEKLIESHADSSFRPDALRETAAIYARREDYRQALNTISRLIAEYPAEAEAAQAARLADEYRFRLTGMSEREASLSAIIGREGGAQTRNGREAMIELSRIYIYESGSQMDFAYQMLQKVIEKDDRETGARAQYLVGEFFYRRNDPVTAAGEFLKAAVLNPSAADLAASSIFRAAEMMALAGRKSDVQELVRRLESNFPSSQWTLEGRRLLERMP